MKKLLSMSLLLAGSTLAHAAELQPLMGGLAVCNADDPTPKTALTLKSDGNAVSAQILGCISSEYRFAPIGNDMTYRYSIPAGQGETISVEQNFRDFELVIVNEDNQVLSVTPGRIEGSKVNFRVGNDTLKAGAIAYLRMRHSTHASQFSLPLEESLASTGFRIR